MYKLTKIYLRELAHFRQLHFESLRTAEGLGLDAYALQEKYDEYSAKLAGFTDSFNKILTNSLPLVIGVAGNFNAGKSSFINSLIGKEILGVKEQPATCKVAIISHHEEAEVKIFKVFRDGKKIETNREEYLQFGLHEKRTSVEQKALEQISHFEIKCRAEILRSIQLVDTPGFSTLSKEDDAIAEAQLEKTDMLIWVFDGTKGSADKSERDRLATMSGKKIFSVVNRIDNQPPSVRDRVLKVFEGIHPFTKVVPYSATEAFEYQANMSYNEASFAMVTKKAMEVQGFNSDFTIGSKGQVYFYTDVNGNVFEAPKKDVRENEYAVYHRRLLEEIRAIRPGITDIKEKVFREELIEFHRQEMEYWQDSSSSLEEGIRELEEEHESFKSEMSELEEQLLKRATEYFEQLQSTLPPKLFDEVFYFQRKPGGFFEDEKHFLICRELDVDDKKRLEEIVEGEFNFYKHRLIRDLNGALDAMDIDSISETETQLIDIFHAKFSEATVDGVYGMTTVWQTLEVHRGYDAIKSDILQNIALFISDTHFANMTYYYLQQICARILADRQSSFDREYQLRHGLFGKIGEVFQTANLQL